MSQRNQGSELGRTVASVLGITEVLVSEWAKWREQKRLQGAGAVEEDSTEWVEKALGAVDDSLAGQGLDPEDTTDEHDTRNIQLGSAQGLVTSLVDDGESYIRIAAELVDVPEDEKLRLTLYQELLEGNLGLPHVFRFCVVDDKVYIACNLTSVDAEPDDVPTYLYWLMNLTDDIDDDFRRRYRKRRVKRPGPTE